MYKMPLIDRFYKQIIDEIIFWDHTTFVVT